jgi:hypothetical protein
MFMRIFNGKENTMHIDEGKKYDKRNMENNLRRREGGRKDFEAYLTRLPDVGDKAYTPEQEGLEAGNQSEFPADLETGLKQKGTKKKGKR